MVSLFQLCFSFSVFSVLIIIFNDFSFCVLFGKTFNMYFFCFNIFFFIRQWLSTWCAYRVVRFGLTDSKAGSSHTRLARFHCLSFCLSVYLSVCLSVNEWVVCFCFLFALKTRHLKHRNPSKSSVLPGVFTVVFVEVLWCVFLVLF